MPTVAAAAPVGPLHRAAAIPCPRRARADGHWAQQIGARLAPLLATHPHPAGVVILAGTNDVLASTGALAVCSRTP